MKKMLIILSAASMVACSQHNTRSYTEAAGAPKSPKTSVLEAGAKLLQGHAPLNAVSAASRRNRANIPDSRVDPLANGWEQGEVIQLQRVAGPGEHRHGDQNAGRAEIRRSGQLEEQNEAH